MRAIMRGRSPAPRPQFTIVGGDKASHDARLPNGASYREHLSKEVSIDSARHRPREHDAPR